MFIQILPWALLCLFVFGGLAVTELRKRAIRKEYEANRTHPEQWHDVTDFVLNTLAESKAYEAQVRKGEQL